MTTDRRRFGNVRSPLGVRLVAAFVAVAVTAVLVFAALTLWRSRHTVGQLARDRQQATAQAIAQTLALTYRANGGWVGSDPHPAMMLAVQAGAGLEVLDATGHRLDPRSPMAGMPNLDAASGGPEQRATVLVDDRAVGLVVVTFTRGELPEAEIHVRDALEGTVTVGSIAAALAALAVAVPLARRVVRPLTRVTYAARALGDGDASARAGHHDAPGELGTLAAAFDEMADRLDAHDRARRNLTADIAHELRTPLTLLQGNCEEVIDGIAPPSLDRFVELHDDILRLRRLVDDLGTLTDADNAVTGPTLRLRPCDLATVVGTALDKLDALANAHQHRIVRRLTPVAVVGDPDRLAQIATNLVTNAFKFTPPGGTITVTVERTGSAARLRVADTGPGIAPGDRAHVFERFYRGEGARSLAGSGIGLAVVDQLVQAHHGRVHLDDVQVGTTIVVELPPA